MKKWVSGLLFAFFTCSVVPVVADTDIYAGVTVGVGIPEVRSTVNFFDGDRITEIYHGGRSAVLAGGLLGLERNWCNLWNLWTALEFSVRYNGYDDTVFQRKLNDITFYKIKLRNHCLYGFDLKVGTPFACYPMTPYLLLGVQVGRWQSRLIAAPGEDPFRFGTTQAGPNLGLGIRWTPIDCWVLDLQYSYSWFLRRSEMNLYGFYLSSSGVVLVEAHHKTRVHQNKLLLSLSVPLYTLKGW